MPIAVSLMLPYLVGLGALLFLLCGSLEEDACTSDRSVLQSIAACLLFGVLINHGLVLLLSRLEASFWAGCFVSVVAFITLAVRKRRLLGRLFPPRVLVVLLVLFLAACCLVISEPVSGWDARSIWFFHAKLIYYNGSVDAGGDWTLPSIGFSHTDYPLLVPILSAQVAAAAGYWNEYLPKLSLAALLFPAILFLLSILDGKWWHVFLAGAPLFFLGPWLTNGYMDGYLALYAGFGCYFFGRWLDGGSRLDLVSGIVAAGIALDLKNEGTLYVLIVTVMICSFFVVGRLYALQKVKWREAGVLFLVATSGWLLWDRKKHLFHLKNDLKLGLRSLNTVQHRLSEGALPIILKYLYVTVNVNLSLGIFLLCLVYKVARKEKPGRGALLCALTALVYLCGIVTIYLATPYNLISFHLPTSNRTMLPVHIMLLAAAFSLFAAPERSLEVPPGRSEA